MQSQSLDISAPQMMKVTDLADSFSFGGIRTIYSQNLISAQVEQSELYALKMRILP